MLIEHSIINIYLSLLFGNLMKIKLKIVVSAEFTINTLIPQITSIYLTVKRIIFKSCSYYLISFNLLYCSRKRKKNLWISILVVYNNSTHFVEISMF